MSILLALDLQGEFLNTVDPSLPWKIADAARGYDELVIAVSMNPEDGPWQTLLGWRGLQSVEAKAVPPVLQGLALPLTFIYKTSYSAASSFLDLARPLSETVHLCGVDTDACVLATAFELFDREALSKRLGLQPR